MIVRLTSPGYLLLAIPAVLAAWWSFRRRGHAGVFFSSRALVSELPRTWRLRAVRIVPFLFWFGLSLAVLALARPQAAMFESRDRAETTAIVMAVDVSGSMDTVFMPAAPDSPAAGAGSRLDAVKAVFNEFVQRRPDDLIGLVTFGGYAVTRVPLTFDHEALLRVLEAVRIPRRARDETGAVANQEELLTALGDGLAMACARLKDSAPRSKVVVLLSDGRQTSGLGAVSPEDATRIARQLGIKVYTIGVGPDDGLDTSPDAALLASIAERCGGSFFLVTDKKGLDAALADIDRLERTPVERITIRRRRELFAFALAPGLLLIVVACATNVVWFGFRA